MLTALSILYLNSGIFLSVAEWPAIKEVSWTLEYEDVKEGKDLSREDASVCLNSREDRKDVLTLSSGPWCQHRGTIWVLHSCSGSHTDCLPRTRMLGAAGLLCEEQLSSLDSAPRPPTLPLVFSMWPCRIVDAEGALSLLEDHPVCRYTTPIGWLWEFMS